MKGVIDRFTDEDQAVILIEKLNKELVVSCDELPDGSKESDWLTLKKTNGSFKIIAIDREKTERETKTSLDLRDQLRAKSKGSKFRRRS